MNIAAIIVGIDGWQRYTLPLIESIRKWEPECEVIVVDNLSEPHYPWSGASAIMIRPTARLCYSAAINLAHDVLCEDYEGDTLVVSDHYDWYVVLSNDVLCTGPFAHILAGYSDENVVGPLMLETPIPGMGMISYIEGWCMAFSRRCWDAIGGFDENYLMSSFEDVDASQEARKAGFWLVEDKAMPFKHLDQRQRFYLPGYGGSEEHNMRLFMRKNGEA